MKTNEWAKTILTVYKYLETVCDSIDKLVSQNALNSFYSRGEKQAENGVMAVADRIIDLSERKSRIINIKVLADKALQNIDRKGAQLLIERYMDNDEAFEIAFRHKLNVRTYFRHLYQAEVNFSQAMARAGFGDEKLSKYLSKEAWILEVYEKFKEEKGDRVEEVKQRLEHSERPQNMPICKSNKSKSKHREEENEELDDCLLFG